MSHWATEYKRLLAEGRTVQFRPTGHSMTGRIESGQLCTVEPFSKGGAPKVGDIVLCTVGLTDYLHLIKAIKGGKYQIGNNRGGLNGWVDRNQMYGRCVEVGQ